MLSKNSKEGFYYPTFNMSNENLGLPRQVHRMSMNATLDEILIENYYYNKMLEEHRAYELMKFNYSLGHRSTYPHMPLTNKGSNLPALYNIRKVKTSPIVTQNNRSKPWSREGQTCYDALPKEYTPYLHAYADIPSVIELNASTKQILLLKSNAFERQKPQLVSRISFQYIDNSFSRNTTMFPFVGQRTSCIETNYVTSLTTVPPKIHSSTTIHTENRAFLNIPEISTLSSTSRFEDVNGTTILRPPPGLIHPKLLEPLGTVTRQIERYVLPRPPPGIPMPNDLLVKEKGTLDRKSKLRLKQQFDNDLLEYKLKLISRKMERFLPKGVFPSTKYLHTLEEIQERLQMIPNVKKPSNNIVHDLELGCVLPTLSSESRAFSSDSVRKATIYYNDPNIDGLLYMRMSTTLFVENERCISAQRKSYSALLKNYSQDSDDDS